MCRKGVTPNEDNHDLSSDDDELNANKEVIPLHAFEDVQFVVDASVVVLVENLHPDEGIED